MPSSKPESKTQPDPAPQHFRGMLDTGLISMDGRPDHRWAAVRLPFHPAEAWPRLNKLRVRGTVNGAAFRTSLIHLRHDSYLFLVKQSLQKQANATPGTVVDIVIEPDLEDRSATPPAELAKLFKADRAVKKWFERLPPSTRNYICDAVADPKSADVRQRRAENWVETLMLVMEGEIDPPPILQLAFRRQPQARLGWQAMTPIQRRTHLLAIFQYQSTEARAKRADKAIEDALKIAKRKSGLSPDPGPDHKAQSSDKLARDTKLPRRRTP